MKDNRSINRHMKIKSPGVNFIIKNSFNRKSVQRTIKHIICGKMDLRLFYFHVTKVSTDLSITVF